MPGLSFNVESQAEIFASNMFLPAQDILFSRVYENDFLHYN